MGKAPHNMLLVPTNRHVIGAKIRTHFATHLSCTTTLFAAIPAATMDATNGDTAKAHPSDTRAAAAAAAAVDDDDDGNDSTTIEEDSAFDILAGNIGLCLYKSDLKRDDGHDGASTGWTSWVDDATAFRLKNCMDKLELTKALRQTQQQQEISATSSADFFDIASKRDEAIRWLRWVKATPSPVVVELGPELRKSVSAAIDDTMLDHIDSTREEFLSRIGCRLIVLPSGTPLTHALRAPPGAMIYGTLLLGGVSRFRLLGSTHSNRPRRRAGERTLVANPNESTKSWLQFGGPERCYEAIDAGPCAFLEVLILPKTFTLPLLLPLFEEIDITNPETGSATELLEVPSVETIEDMTIGQMKWNVRDIFDFEDPLRDAKEVAKLNDCTATQGETEKFDERLLASGQDYLDYLESSFTASVGGLQPQIDNIIRRVLDGRSVGSTTEAIDGNNETNTNSNADTVRREEMEALLDLGLQPVRGLLLYGQPGTGKTLVARELSKVLKARPPKIVAAPELLDRWVGGSEKLVRELFEDAEAELKACNGDPTKSALHVIVIDEIDAVFRKRSAVSEDSGEITRASTVNQILAKLDGISELGNILLIGMTNRRELLDRALLRPGRLEVQIEIPLPDQEGRREILNIHFEALRQKGLLSKSLCDAIDGRGSSGNSIENECNRGLVATLKSKLSFQKSQPDQPKLWHRRIRDLADSRWTGGFSGADIAGLTRAAGSLALARARKQDGGGLENLLITLEDVAQALDEVKQ